MGTWFDTALLRWRADLAAAIVLLVVQFGNNFCDLCGRNPSRLARFAICWNNMTSQCRSQARGSDVRVEQMSSSVCLLATFRLLQSVFVIFCRGSGSVFFRVSKRYASSSLYELRLLDESAKRKSSRRGRCGRRFPDEVPPRTRQRNERRSNEAGEREASEGTNSSPPPLHLSSFISPPSFSPGTVSTPSPEHN